MEGGGTVRLTHGGYRRLERRHPGDAPFPRGRPRRAFAGARGGRPRCGFKILASRSHCLRSYPQEHRVKGMPYKSCPHDGEECRSMWCFARGCFLRDNLGDDFLQFRSWGWFPEEVEEDEEK